MLFWRIIFLLDAAAQVCLSTSNQIIKIYIVSDLNTKVVGPFQEANSFKTQPGSWLANIPEATWIWDAYQATEYKTVTFKVSFALPGIPKSGILRVAFDDILVSVTINNAITSCSFSNYMDGSEQNFNITDFLLPGMNIVLFTVKNVGGCAGLLYLLNISIAI